MKLRKSPRIALLAGFCLMLSFSWQAGAEVHVQCPGDVDGDGIPDRYFKVFAGQRTGWVNNAAGTARCTPTNTTGTPCVRVTVTTPGRLVNSAWRSNVKCMHITCGDGYQSMGDGNGIYMFGFRDATGLPPATALVHAFLAAEWPSPSIAIDEGDEFYLTLTNVNMAVRPDLFDPHSVHFHGFPQASSVFDGMPEGSISVMGGSSLTYYYKIVIPGTYMYHCHVEAAEHMQMGMLGNLYVRPKQDKATPGTLFGGHLHQAGDLYAYNDGDGSTFCNKEIPIQLGSFDRGFHFQSQSIQSLDFFTLKSSYAQLNGRGYPDTIRPGPLPWTPPQDNYGGEFPVPGDYVPKTSQNVDSVITATAGQKVLLRFSSLDVTSVWTVTGLGLPLKVVGIDGRLLRSTPSGGGAGQNLAYETSSVTLGGGMAADVLIDTTGIAPGTYFIYTTNLNYLANDTEDYGGMMTEFVVQ
jgi:FtsP/CotA-like multicopper oxidase with cupredoxin domain